MKPGKLTVHCIVRNEPFVYYAIKSVYKFVDVILLYDTGSTDHTLEDIGRLLAEDRDRKILFQHLPIVDETGWTKRDGGVQIAMEQSKRNFETTGRNMASLRRQQIAETETEFFLLVDGDEIFYQKTIRGICEHTILNFPADKIAGAMRRDWFIDPEHKYRHRRPCCRLFRTAATDVVREYPDEYHCRKDTKQIIRRSDPWTCNVALSLSPIAHFEPYLKPHRGIPEGVQIHEVARSHLPEVMLDDDRYIKRYEREQGYKQWQSYSSPRRYQS